MPLWAALLLAACTALLGAAVAFAAARSREARLRADLAQAGAGAARAESLARIIPRLRHDVRGALSPVMLTADRMAMHADPAVARAGEVIVRAVERAIELLDATRQEAPPRPETEDKAP